MTDGEVLKINKQKFEIEFIGRGGFAKVYKAKVLDGDGYPGEYVAIKKISITDTKWSKHKPFVKEEIRIHGKLDHPNIVKLYNVVSDKEAIYLILELCECSLADYVKKQNSIKEKDVYNIFKQIVNGVQYLHSKQVIHRDLTLRNILLTKDMQVKIADFGLSTYLNEADDPRYTVCGTQNYMAPEMKGGKGHKEKVDCWNLGCILYALFDGEPPQTEKGEVVNYPKNISHEAKELLQKLLAKKPTERTCIEAVPDFKFFKKYERTKSKNSLYRSDDSGNGSRNHLSSPTEKESHFRSLDSGFNSKNSSGKRSNSSRKKYHSVEKLAEQNFDLQRVKLFPSRNFFSNGDHTHDRKRSASKDRRPYKPLSCKNPQQMHSSRERSASAERARIKDLKLSCHHDYANDAHRIISSDCCKSQERYKNNDCTINSPWNTLQSFNPEPTDPCDDPSCRFSNILLEGQHKVSPSPCSHTGCFDTKCSHVATCCCHSHSYHKHHLPNINNPEKLNKHCQEQLTSPLNAARLRPKRHMPKDLKNTVLHISADNQVIMEVLKTRKGKKIVCEVIIISTDGMKIKMYKPPKNTHLDDDHPPPFPKDSSEIKSYDYQMLPKMYHENYLVAKQFVDVLRAKKPKFINNAKNGRFYAMENSPDPDMKMEFYYGGSVVKKGQIIEITDKLGRSKKCFVYDETITKNLDQDFKLMLEEFLNEKEDCERILTFHESLRSPNFPIVLGDARNKLTYPGQNAGKENFAPTSKTNR